VQIPPAAFVAKLAEWQELDAHNIEKAKAILDMKAADALCPPEASSVISQARQTVHLARDQDGKSKRPTSR
jgi:hypothetical protein